MSKISGIYMIKNKVNGKIYIGRSVNIYKRWSTHKNELKKHRHCNDYLQKAWNKYKEENFELLVIKQTSDKIAELIKEEQRFLDLYKPFKKNGYNLSKSSRGPKGAVRKDLSNYNKKTKSKKVYQYDLDGQDFFR